jgi:arginyl-tRNA synthetase
VRDICKEPVRHAKEQVEQLIAAAARKATQAGQLPECALPAFTVEIPADAAHGDFAANAAMVGARAYRMPPVKIAHILLENLAFEDRSFFARAEVAGPGFLNFFLRPDWFVLVLNSVLQLKDAYGKTDYGQGEKIMVEFVSANPTGPMHMGNARGGMIGDCLAAAMEASGYDVTREFYVNDAGNQIEKFGLSLEARYLQIYKGEAAVPFPEDGYHGADIMDRAREFAALQGDAFVETSAEERRAALVGYALPHNIVAMRETLQAYRIEYNQWFHESTLHESGAVQRAVDLLTERGLAYESEGAVWYKATAMGAEKDEVLVRQNGSPTYFAADIAYHYNKFVQRGFDRVIDVWGADHHGHVARLKGAMDAIGVSGDKLDIVLMQLVRLMKDGEPYRMSKRSGRSVTLEDLLDMVPVDAARFMFNMREPNSTMDFDLDLAVQQSVENPVYYVQYAHARICSILRKLNEDGIAPRECTNEELKRLTAPEEIELIRVMARFPGAVINAATRYDPASLTHYAQELAALVHKFYTTCRVRVEDETLMQARICLCICCRTTVANILNLMKISVPERM